MKPESLSVFKLSFLRPIKFSALDQLRESGMSIREWTGDRRMTVRGPKRMLGALKRIPGACAVLANEVEVVRPPILQSCRKPSKSCRRRTWAEMPELWARLCSAQEQAHRIEYPFHPDYVQSLGRAELECLYPGRDFSGRNRWVAKSERWYDGRYGSRSWYEDEKGQKQGLQIEGKDGKETEKCGNDVWTSSWYVDGRRIGVSNEHWAHGDRQSIYDPNGRLVQARDFSPDGRLIRVHDRSQPGSIVDYCIIAGRGWTRAVCSTDLGDLL